MGTSIANLLWSLRMVCEDDFGRYLHSIISMFGIYYSRLLTPSLALILLLISKGYKKFLAKVYVKILFISVPSVLSVVAISLIICTTPLVPYDKHSVSLAFRPFGPSQSICTIIINIL